MRATKKNKQIKNIAGKYFLSPEINLSFRNVFLSPEIDCFSEICNNLMRALGRKKHMFFLVLRGLNLMRALIENRDKKHSGLKAKVNS